MYYYAYIDSTNTVTGTYALPSAITADGYIAITEQQHNDSQAGNENSLIGKVYDASTGTFNDPIIWSGSTDEVEYKDTETSLSTKLDQIDDSIAALGTGSSVDAYTKTETDTLLSTKANTTDLHSHDNKTVLDSITAEKVALWDAGTGSGDVDLTGYLTETEAATTYASINHNHNDAYATVENLNGKADSTHNHDTVYAPISHTHTDYASTDHTHSEYAEANHTHDGYATNGHTHNDYITTTTYANGMSGKADTDHTHSGYASSSHTHSEYASSSHTHSGYASSSHTHSGYLSTSGGTVSGDVAVTGVVRVGGQQAIYNSGSQMILGTGNLPTNIACDSSSDVTVNGARMQIPSLLPRNGGSFQIGNSTYRFSGIYLTNSPNVSSDARLKENISELNIDEAVKLINELDVVSFNYINDDAAQVGVIAQNIIEVSPEMAQALVTQGDDGYYGVKTSDLVFPLIAAVQALTKRVEELENK